jgi:hypothetical protein
MNPIARIEQRRNALLQEMATIRSLERATLTKQMLRVKHKGKKKPVLRGPYYVLARWENGKTRSRRVQAEELERLQREVANHDRFMALCEEFMELTERLGELEREADSEQEAVKKGLKSRSSRAGKSGV